MQNFAGFILGIVLEYDCRYQLLGECVQMFERMFRVVDENDPILKTRHAVRSHLRNSSRPKSDGSLPTSIEIRRYRRSKATVRSRTATSRHFEIPDRPLRTPVSRKSAMQDWAQTYPRTALNSCHSCFASFTPKGVFRGPESFRLLIT
ncbi:MAG: hypothetical protein DMG97_30450 [Acidobacteria bacterium]|nr:MAG: hypothetical protein DMG97_30450 [Acidobacteriota bacterium]